MQPLAIRTLHFALIAAWFAISSAAIAEPKSQYGGFSSDDDGRQAYLDYINGLEMIQVEAGAELQQAVEAIPVEPGIPHHPRARSRPARLALRLSRRLFRLRQRQPRRYFLLARRCR